jgi:hypothetical protein
MLSSPIAGGSTAHTLVYGSGYATRQAFNRNFNAELLTRFANP